MKNKFESITFIMLLLLVLMNSCSNNEGLYIGQDRVFYDSLTFKTHKYENDHLLLIENDSLKFSRLLDYGCAFVDQEMNFKFYADKYGDEFIINGNDSIAISLKKDKVGGLLKLRVGSFLESFKKIKSYDVLLDWYSLNDLILGNTYTLEFKGAHYSISFYEWECIIKVKSQEEHYIIISKWNLIQADQGFFISVEMIDHLLTFQLIGINENGNLEANVLGDGNIQEVIHVELMEIFKPKYSKSWSFEQDVVYTENILLNNNENVIWNSINKEFIESDYFEFSSSFYMKDTIHIDWGTKSIITGHDDIFSFEILNGGKIEVFPTSRKGNVNLNFSKIYMNKDSPNTAPPPTRRNLRD